MTSTDLSILAQRFVQALAEKGSPTLREVGRATKIDHGDLSKLRSGQLQSFGIDRIARLATYFDKTSGWFLGEDAPPPATAAVLHVIDSETSVPLNTLVASPLNPRKHFDAESIAQLADNIVAQGVLQNLTARSSPTDPDKLEVYVGGRRLRALNRAVEQGRLPADYPVPIKLRQAEDKEVLAIATAENVARKDMHPLEEGDAFTAMVEAGYTKDDLARLFGNKTVRWIELRMQLSQKLMPMAKALFLSGKINTEIASELMKVSADAQDVHIKAIAEGQWGYATARDVRSRIATSLPAFTAAIFDTALYTGDLVGDAPDPEDEDNLDDDERSFADVAQFRQLQQAAIVELEAKLRAKFAWVEVINLKEGEHFRSWEHHRAWTKADGKNARGAVIVIDPDLSVETSESVTKNKGAKAQATGATTATEKGASDSPPPPKSAVDQLTRGQMQHAEHIRTHALQWAIAADPKAPMALAIIGLIGGQGYGHTIGIRTERVVPVDRFALHPSIPLALEAKRAKGGAKLLRAMKDHSETGEAKRSGDKAAGELWTWLMSLDLADLTELFALVVAARVTSGVGAGAPGEKPLTLAMADTLQVNLAKGWRIDADYLGVLRKPQLIQLARAIGMFYANALREDDKAAADPVQFAKLRGPVMVQAILDYVVANDVRYLPPEVRFLADGPTKRALRKEMEPGSRVQWTKDGPTEAEPSDSAASDDEEAEVAAEDDEGDDQADEDEADMDAGGGAEDEDTSEQPTERTAAAEALDHVTAAVEAEAGTDGKGEPIPANVERQASALRRLWGTGAPQIAKRYLDDAERLNKPGQLKFWKAVAALVAA